MSSKLAIVLTTMLLFSIEGCRSACDSPDVARLFYIPFDLETFVPVTTSNIEEMSRTKVCIDLKDRDLKRLVSIIGKAKPGKFDNSHVRVKLIIPEGQEIYLDNVGGILMGSSKKTLDSNTMKRVRALIDSLT